MPERRRLLTKFMNEIQCDVLIVGGGTGGSAAAMAACSLGLRVVLTEETDWLGGQLTSQIVPPDEHPWIESFGATDRYRAYRRSVRQFYRDHTPLMPTPRSDPKWNPGGGWVSDLCHEPRIGWHVLMEMLLPALCSGRLDLRLRTVPSGGLLLSDAGRTPTDSARPQVDGDRVTSVPVVCLESGAVTYVRAKYVLDATELGELLPLTGTEYVSGAESRVQTGELGAVEGAAEPENVQGLTWCMAFGYDPGSNRVIDRPESYPRWRDYRPCFSPGPQLGYDVLHAITGEVKQLPLFSDDWYELFSYRQIVDPACFEAGYHPHPVTVVNWPQNDYFVRNIIDKPHQQAALALSEARELSLSTLYWLQTEAPRHDGGVGYPGLYLRPDIMGTSDGFAKTPYIRESRRIRARRTVHQQDVAAASHPGLDRAPQMRDSVGIGSYHIDLHASTNEKPGFDAMSLPFQIPLGALIPERMTNLLPACKNLGVTHITNGCYRLHPVEWNIGESAGLLASFCILKNRTPAGVWESPEQTAEFQILLRSQGIPLEWPALGPR